MTIRTIERCAVCGALAIEGVEVDLQRREVRFAGSVVRLTEHEIAIVYRLVERGGRIVPYQQVEFAIWGNRIDGGPEQSREIMKVHLVRVRRKFREAGIPLRIAVSWGVGLYIETTRASETATDQRQSA